jgi:hypothetical protein
VLDGRVEDVIARHHELLSDAEGARPAMSSAHQAPVGGVRVVHRELVGLEGTRSDVVGDGNARLRFRIAFDEVAVDPQVHFAVLAEDRTIVYEASAPLSPTPRRFEVRDEVAAEVSFTPRVNGGSFRLMLTVTAEGGDRVLHRDENGLLVYIPPVLGTSGLADLGATITLDGAVLTDHPDVSL